MIVKNQEQLTEAVIETMQKTPDPRLREIMTLLAKHLHAFVKEAKLTEPEWQMGLEKLIAIGQASKGTHNEAVLMAGSLGLSQLVCLMNNSGDVDGETTANLLGPFWRAQSPPAENGSSLLRSDTPGPALFVNATVKDLDGKPVEGARVDVWHSSPVGLYEHQDPAQAEMNLRGTFSTDKDGRFWFKSVKPAGYPIPVDGVVGELLKAQKRQHYRPAHLHVLIHKDGYKTLVSQVYVNDDPLLEVDPQFGVTERLIGNFVRHDEPAADKDIDTPWYSLDYDFVIEPGEARLPRPPIE